MKTITKATLILTAAALMTGCISNPVSQTGNTYTTVEARKPQKVSWANITHVTDATLQNANSGLVGTLGGGYVGYKAGGSVGKGNGSDIASVVGMIGGALAGSAIEHNLRESNAQEITVRFDNGNEYAIVQENDPSQPLFKVGERVRVSNNGYALRVTR